MKYIVNLPWKFKYPGVKYNPYHKVQIFEGEKLPSELHKYASEPYSYERWVEDDLNKKVRPSRKAAHTFKPMDHQKDAARKIVQSYESGWAGFLMADKTGLGKTLSSLLGLSAIAKRHNFTPKKKANLLIVCPKGAIPQWRNTIAAYPPASALFRIIVINYHQLNKLLKEPASTKKAKKRSTKTRNTAKSGTPKHNWDFIVYDEAHYLKNYPTSTMSNAAVSIASTNKAYRRGDTPFVIYSTATPGSSPLNFAVMANFMSKLLSNGTKVVSPSYWGGFLEQQGFAVKKGKNNWNWASVPGFGKNSDDPEEVQKYKIAERKAKLAQREDAKKIGKALTHPKAPFIMRSPKDLAGWPEQQYIPYPIELTLDQWPIYHEAWSRFRQFLRLPGSRRDSKAQLVEQLRYRQKSSILKVDAMVDMIEDFVQTGHQVYVSCEFMDTIDKYVEKLSKRRIRAIEISGRNVNEREAQRLKFQRGEADVVLCTVVEAISLHSGETLPDGSTASTTPRITIIHDVRQNNLDTDQAAGRAHRSGQNSVTYFPMFAGTVDEKVIRSYTNKTANMKTMTGESEESAEMLDTLFQQAAEQ